MSANPDTNKPFANRTVVVTGAGAGIGRALAIGFARDGANVVAFSRSDANLAQTAALVVDTDASDHFLAVTGDVGSEKDVQDLFTAANAQWGTVDILVNNAAIYPRSAFLDATNEEWQQVLGTNVTGVASCARHALPSMLEKGYGRILNVSSFAWMAPIPGAAAYSVSKAAVRTLTRAIATEIDSAQYPDVLVNEFVPGVVNTSMSDSGMAPDAVYPMIRSVVLQPAGSATGRTYNGDQLHEEDHGIKARIKRKLRRLGA